jgi:hypothetical protein
MAQEAIIARKEALKKLSRYGIEGAFVYLVDVIPLIEMVWADGIAQDSEIAIIDAYLHEHVNHINMMADSNILSFEDAHDFISGFLSTKPDPEFLKALRSMVAPVRLSTSDMDFNNAVRESLLATCMDIASSAASQYPHKLSERFDPAEKRCFFEILDTLTNSQVHHQI